MVKTNYQCEECGTSFDDYNEAVAHEAIPVNPAQLQEKGLYKFENNPYYSSAVGIVLGEDGIVFSFSSGEHFKSYTIQLIRTDKDMKGVYSNSRDRVLSKIRATGVEELTEDQFKVLQGILKRRLNIEDIVRGEILKV